MAKRVTEIMIDDLDGSEITPENGGTVHFAFQGMNYEIDLSDKNTAEFTELLANYIDKARKVAAVSKTNRKGASRTGSLDLSIVRTWLRDQGHNVSTRGRIPADLIALYEANQ